jgi:histidinol phosphatase-like PHP family hydrolase
MCAISVAATNGGIRAGRVNATCARNFRLGLRADWRRVFEYARDHDRAIEIDGYPDRQDLFVELLRLARDAGTLISFGSDAHAPNQLAFLDFSVAAACEAGIRASHILNCWTVDELLAWTGKARS